MLIGGDDNGGGLFSLVRNSLLDLGLDIPILDW